MRDTQEPSNIAIFYEGKIEEDSEVTLILSVAESFTIPAQYLQYGYRLYKEDYNLISTLDTTSCAL